MNAESLSFGIRQVGLEQEPRKIRRSIKMVWKIQSGVYSITNTVTGDCYVGASLNLRNRYLGHSARLKDGRHTPALQASYDLHGSEVFVFEVLELCEADEACIRKSEEKFRRLLRPVWGCGIPYRIGTPRYSRS